MTTSNSERDAIMDAAGRILHFEDRKYRDEVGVSLVSFPRKDIENLLGTLADYILSQKAEARRDEELQVFRMLANIASAKRDGEPMFDIVIYIRGHLEDLEAAQKDNKVER